MSETQTAAHVEIGLANGEHVRVDGDLAGFRGAIEASGSKLVVFTEIPNGNEIVVNTEQIASAKPGEHPVRTG